MFNVSLRRGGERAEPPPRVNGSQHENELSPLAPWSNEDGVREIRQYKVSPQKKAKKGADRLPGRLLAGASVLIFAALAGAGFVAYEAQRLFAEAHNHTGATLTEADKVRALIVAALPDVGWIAMALIALVAALRGQSSLRARVGIMVFFALSLSAQVLYAPDSPEGILVAVIAPISLAWMLETLIIEVRRWAGSRLGIPMDETPILTGTLLTLVRVLRGVLGLFLWTVRLLLDRKGTWSGVRDWVLDTAPLAPGRTRASLTAAAALEQASSADQAAEQARAEAAKRVAEIEATAAAERERLERGRAEAEQALREERDEQLRAAIETERMVLQQQAQRHREELRAEQAQYEAAVSGLRRELANLQSALDATKDERDRLAELAEAKTGRERLITLYEQLGHGGDPRYMDISRAAEVARELAERAGLQSEGTARNYLYDHIRTRLGHEMSPAGVMIEEGGS